MSKTPQEASEIDCIGLLTETVGILNKSLPCEDALGAIAETIQERAAVEAVIITAWPRSGRHLQGVAGFGERMESVKCCCGHSMAISDANDKFVGCAVKQVLSGGSDTDHPCFTDNGSFWTNSFNSLVSSGSCLDWSALCPSSAQAMVRRQFEPFVVYPRSQPEHESIYESLAFSPLKSNSEITGIIQVYDYRPNWFTPNTIKCFEGIASAISTVLNHKYLEDQLRTRIRYLEAELLESSYSLTKVKRKLEREIDKKSDFEKRFREAFEFISKLIETSPIGICTCNAEGEFTLTNAALEEFAILKGFRELESKEQMSNWSFWQETELMDLIKEVVENGNVREKEIETTSINGTKIWLQCKLSLFFSNDEPQVLLTFNNVTASKLAGEEMRKNKAYLQSLIDMRTKELTETNRKLLLEIEDKGLVQSRLRKLVDAVASANKDLEHFAYVASHDLKEPLRTIASFVELLRRRNSGKLDDHSERFIGYITDGVRRMDKLISDLLLYSKVGVEGHHHHVNVMELLGNITADLEPLLVDADCTLTYEKLPMIYGVESDVARLLQNLITNAVKFSGNGSCRIHIKAERLNNQWVFSVADNGIGIAPEFRERVFQMFQRLHTSREFPGTGIGLAICKRIVEKRSGRIWVESEPGKGSTFKFTWPMSARN